MAYLSLSPVLVGIYSMLNVAGLTALVSTRIYDDVPQAPTFPFVWFEAREHDSRGFGTGGFPTVELRVHAFSQYEGTKEAQSIIQKVIQLLRDQAVTVSGYTQGGLVVYDETVDLPISEINGIKCREMVAMFRLFVEES